jgi:hypothetical protein
MRSFCILVIVFMVYVLCSQTYGQTQETKEPFPYESWHFLYEPKCSKCHTLKRIFAEPKTEGEWRICVTRMIQKSPAWITPEEGEQIIAEILGNKKHVCYIKNLMTFFTKTINYLPVNTFIGHKVH